MAMKLKQDSINASLMLDIWHLISCVFVGLAYCRINLFVVTATSGSSPEDDDSIW